jgi:hypothetical protein
VLDFAMAKRGTRLHDLTRLYLQVELLGAKPRFRSSVLGKLQLALLRGFDAALTTSDPLFRYMLMLHRINHLATVSSRKSPFRESLYNLYLRRIHGQRIVEELRSGAAAQSVR